jgi:hypothetical protein
MKRREKEEIYLSRRGLAEEMGVPFYTVTQWLKTGVIPEKFVHAEARGARLYITINRDAADYLKDIAKIIAQQDKPAEQKPADVAEPDFTFSELERVFSLRFGESKPPKPHHKSFRLTPPAPPVGSNAFRTLQIGGISVLRHVSDRGVSYSWKGTDGRSYKIICDNK